MATTHPHLVHLPAEGIATTWILLRATAVVEGCCGVVALTLPILVLAHALPLAACAGATLAIGIGLFLEGAVLVPRYRRVRLDYLDRRGQPRALELEGRRERDLPPERRFSRPHAYFSRGLYAERLEPWFALFPRERILCLRCEDIARQPRRLAERLHRFLGLEARGDDVHGLGLINAAEREGAEAPATATFQALRTRYAEPNRRLAELLGPQFEIWL